PRQGPDSGRHRARARVRRRGPRDRALLLDRRPPAARAGGPRVPVGGGALGVPLCYWIVGRQRPGAVSRGFRFGQVLSGGMLALAHGTNDAQKTMGVITLALIANGTLAEDADVPFWVVISAATAIALGTYTGGWRIIRTMGSRIIKMDS